MRPAGVLVVCVLMVLAAACAQTDEAPQAQIVGGEGSPAAGARSRGEAPGAGDPSAPMSASEVYARVAPWVVFLETPIGTGTGVWIGDDLLLTNAHVVWPYDAARVAWGDDNAVEEVPVVGSDLVGDVAVLELPPGVAAPRGAPLEFAAGDELAIGSELFLVGFPAEVENFPQPAITRGILSRRRSWPAQDLVFLQTDAAITGGQSGGVLADARGRVVGISSMTFGEPAFGLAFPAVEALDRALRLAEGEDIDGAPEREPPLSGGRSRQRVVLDHLWDERALAVSASYDRPVELRVTGADMAYVTVIDAFGDVAAEAEVAPGASDTISFTVALDGPYYVLLGSGAGGTAVLDVTADAPLVVVDDPDDGVALALDRVHAGALDYPGDIDSYVLDLARGQSVMLTADTINFAADLFVDLPADPNAAPALGDPTVDVGLGLAAHAEFTAAATGRYVVVVTDIDGFGIGGYLLEVR